MRSIYCPKRLALLCRHSAAGIPCWSLNLIIQLLLSTSPSLSVNHKLKYANRSGACDLAHSTRKRTAQHKGHSAPTIPCRCLDFSAKASISKPSSLTGSVLTSSLTQVITQLRSLTAALFGIACGILGLESYYGFGFYLLFTTFTSFLIWVLMCKGRQGDYFQSPLSELWSGDLMGSALGFVLFWTAGYGIVRA